MTEPFDAVDVIRAKRDKEALGDAQIDWVIDAYTRGVVADEQMSALAMAIFLNGMTRPEIARWTNAMIASGERMDFAALGKPTADKHSTGGVGDKITLPLAPLVAVFGVAVPQLSGRGLGHTGGTLDKLEAIPGWRASLSNEEIMDQLRDVGAVICAGSCARAVRSGTRLLNTPVPHSTSANAESTSLSNAAPKRDSSFWRRASCTSRRTLEEPRPASALLRAVFQRLERAQREGVPRALVAKVRSPWRRMARPGR